MELRIENLQKSYGAKAALKGINMTMTEGIYGLLGPNGAGKSTLMNIVTGNLPATAGRITLDGQDIRALGSSFRARLGYMPQQQVFYPGFTAERFLFYIASLRGMERQRAAMRIDWALELLGLADVRNKTIRGLSGGMRQRLLLAQAILDDPDILILDEPTAGLDPKQRIIVRNLIGEIALHKIVLISTHVVSDVEYVAKELVLLSEGEILCTGTQRTLTSALNGMVWETTVPEAEVTKLHGTICGVAKAEDGVFVRLLSPQKPPFPAEPVRPTLEDVYLSYFGEAEGL